MFSGWKLRSASGSWPIPDMAPAGDGRDPSCSSRLRRDPGWPEIVGKTHINPFPKRAIRASGSPSPQCWVFRTQTAVMSMRGNHAV
ncbi:hypothetical protein ASPFODRAFT_65476 [Aspergillus luchuensis CBS 106.47]|uniref:Uncharacterized protein n=1 Tax=Aspergillus luchuensis (strain CBS 106.47) TaxID=1137211 RepID=A0A1M3T2H6_ASPLC|nr:hypothetical protein ASPFODRAFT_65476 [Aspergillus luchuensis CBS 106.47]